MVPKIRQLIAFAIDLDQASPDFSEVDFCFESFDVQKISKIMGLNFGKDTLFTYNSYRFYRIIELKPFLYLSR